MNGDSPSMSQVIMGNTKYETPKPSSLTLQALSKASKPYLTAAKDINEHGIDRIIAMNNACSLCFGISCMLLVNQTMMCMNANNTAENAKLLMFILSPINLIMNLSTLS